jgi:hypothetical protein
MRGSSAELCSPLGFRVAWPNRRTPLLLRVQLENVHWFVGERTFDAADHFKHDKIRAFGASWEFFTLADGHGMGQAMLRVNNAVDPAVGNRVTGVVFGGAHQQPSKATGNSSRRRSGTLGSRVVRIRS